MKATLCIAFFPSKTLMSEHHLPSKKLKMDYVGPLYIYSKFERFLFVLATIDGIVIEQVFHTPCLKHGYLRLNNSKTITNINDLPEKFLTKNISCADITQGVSATCMAT